MYVYFIYSKVTTLTLTSAFQAPRHIHACSRQAPEG